MTRPGLDIVGLVALAVAVRGLRLLTPGLDSDMAIVGLMARHILQGEFPIFYWGQPFAGTMEAYLAALLFALGGASRLTLALSPFLFSLLLLAVTYRLAREAFDRETGWLALLLAALPAPFLVNHSVTARANYIENLVLGGVVLVLALRIPSHAGVVRRRSLALLGFFAGLAWYQSPQSVHYLLTAGLFLLLRDPRVLLERAFWAAPAAFALGSLPLWLYNLGGPSVSTIEAILLSASPAGLLDSLTRFFGHKVPATLATAPWGAGRGELALTWFVVALHALATLYLLRRWRQPGSQLLLLFVLATSAILVVGYNEGSGTRYLLPLHSAVPVMTAAFLAALRRRSAGVFAVALAGLLVANVVGNLAVAEIVDPKKRAAYEGRVARDAQLFALLEGEGLTRVYVFDFWDAYRLTFDAGERIIFTEPVRSFYPPYVRMVDDAERYAYVVRGGAEAFEEDLRSAGGRYRKREVPGYAVFDAFAPRGGPALRGVSRAGWRATASHAPDDAAEALDGNPLTSWGTGRPQEPGAYYEVDLGAVHMPAEVTILAGRSPRNAPRAFRLEVSRDRERWQTILASRQGLLWEGARLRFDPDGAVHVGFAPVPARWVRVSLLGADPGYEWAIRELYLSEPAPDAPGSSPGAEALARGGERARAGDWPGALRAFQEAVDREPDRGEAHIRMLGAYRQLGIERVDPHERALALEARGLFGLAAWEFWSAVRGFPHSNHTYPLQRLLALGGRDGATDRAAQVREQLGRFLPAEPVGATFGGTLRLLGYTADRREVEPGGTVSLSYFWECLRTPGKDYAVFVHLRGEDATFGDDHEPLGGLYPTSRWRPGEVVREDRRLRVPATLRPGPLAVTVGIWDPRTGERLRVEGKGPFAGADRVPLTRLLVTERPGGGG